MRIAGGIVGIFLALIILVQSLAAGTVNALTEETERDSSGSIGFFVAVLFVVGSGLLLGNVLKGATWVWAAAAVLALVGAIGTIFGDLYVWAVVALVYAAACFSAIRRARKVESAESSA